MFLLEHLAHDAGDVVTIGVPSGVVGAAVAAALAWWFKNKRGRESEGEDTALGKSIRADVQKLLDEHAKNESDNHKEGMDAHRRNAEALAELRGRLDRRE